MPPGEWQFLAAAAPSSPTNPSVFLKKRPNSSTINTSKTFANFRIMLIIKALKSNRINERANKPLRINTSEVYGYKPCRINTSRKHAGRGALYLAGSLPDDRISANNFCISAWMCVFDATISGSPGRYGAAPSNRVTLPPASRTSSAPAAVSHDFSPNSQKPSNRPQATDAKSNAADPSRRTP